MSPPGPMPILKSRTAGNRSKWEGVELPRQDARESSGLGRVGVLVAQARPFVRPCGSSPTTPFRQRGSGPRANRRRSPRPTIEDLGLGFPTFVTIPCDQDSRHTVGLVKRRRARERPGPACASSNAGRRWDRRRTGGFAEREFRERPSSVVPPFDNVRPRSPNDRIAAYSSSTTSW